VVCAGVGSFIVRLFGVVELVCELVIVIILWNVIKYYKMSTNKNKFRGCW